MIDGKKIVVVMPAYNASSTLEKTYEEIPHDIVDAVILVDDSSSDQTASIARKIGINKVIELPHNLGYGGNQKVCYRNALDINADIIVMLHPDYQYSPKLISSMCSVIASGLYPVVFGSRILGGGALLGGMPLYKYIANRFLTFFQNLVLGQKLSEYHTGYRAFSADVLRNIKFESNSDNFIFDNQIISQIFMANYEIAEVTCPTKYFEDASSISLSRSIRYGLGVIHVTLIHRLTQWKLINSDIY
jgi:glycosyltransferase involved in cell wall biosynthesis